MKIHLTIILIYVMLLSNVYAQTEATVNFPVNVGQVNLIDISASSREFSLSRTQNAGAGFVASLPLMINLDYSSNSQNSTIIGPQKIVLSIDNIPSGLNFSTLFKQMGKPLKSDATTASANRATFNSDSLSNPILTGIQNTAVTGSILEFELDENSINFAQAGSNTIELIFTLSDDF